MREASECKKDRGDHVVARVRESSEAALHASASGLQVGSQEGAAGG